MRQGHRRPPLLCSSSLTSRNPMHLITPHHTSSHLITSHHISSHLITSHLITSHLITSHHISSHLITSQHNTSQHITTHHNTSQHITTHHNTSQHITTHHNTSQHITTHRNTSQHITTQHNTTQHNTTQHITTHPAPSLETTFRSERQEDSSTRRAWKQTGKTYCPTRTSSSTLCYRMGRRSIPKVAVTLCKSRSRSFPVDLVFRGSSSRAVASSSGNSSHDSRLPPHPSPRPAPSSQPTPVPSFDSPSAVGRNTMASSSAGERN